MNLLCAVFGVWCAAATASVRSDQVIHRFEIPVSVSRLPMCDATRHGLIGYVNDSSVRTFGANVVGGGESAVVVACAPSGWIVVAVAK